MLFIFGFLGMALAGLALPTGGETPIETEETPEEEDQTDTSGLSDILESDTLVTNAPAQSAHTGPTDGDDTLHGTNEVDNLAGQLGDDTVYAGDGNDTVIGGMGNDLVFGGDGNDTIHGYYDDDTLIGGAGHDTMFGGNGDDILDGRDTDMAKDFLNGGAGDDWILADANDHVNSGSGSDTIAVLVNDQGPAVLDDFDPREDTLIIGYPAGSSPPELTAVADNGGIMIFADENAMLYLQNSQSVDLGQIRLEAI